MWGSGVVLDMGCGASVAAVPDHGQKILVTEAPASHYEARPDTELEGHVAAGDQVEPFNSNVEGTENESDVPGWAWLFSSARWGGSVHFLQSQVIIVAPVNVQSQVALAVGVGW